MTDKRILLGKKIKEIRTKRGFTQEYFSELINIDTSTLSNIENGKGYPSMQTLFNIIECFCIDPKYIFDFEYLKDDIFLEKEMMEKIKTLSHEKKQLLYKIIMQF